MAAWTWTFLAIVSIGFAAEPTDNLIACGAERVFIFDPAKPAERLWTWQAADSPTIPEAHHNRFRSTDDCKPYVAGAMLGPDGTLVGPGILITSSSSGVAYIERKTKACAFLATSKNAHSACLLPFGQLAVAASFGGDELQLYDTADKRTPAKPVQALPLLGAHGCVWDERRSSLYALGSDELLRLERPVTNATWIVRERWKLPTPGGHDLIDARDAKRLFVTSNTQVLSFHREDKRFTHEDGFGNQLKVKSVDRNPNTRKIVWHQGTKTTWWSDTVRFQPGEPIRLEGERLYKVRWDVPAPLPHGERAIAADIRSSGATVFLDRSGRITEVNANRKPITDVQLARLASCSQMTDLSLEETDVTADSLAPLAELTNLEWLNLYKAKVGDAGLAHIARLPRLQHLPIGENGITDKGLKAIAKKKTLTYLGLRANPITNAGLHHLRALDLKELNLAETNVTKLGALTNMKRLEKIWIGELELAAGELEAFKKAHPACAIVRD